MLHRLQSGYITWLQLLRASWHTAVVSVAAQSLAAAAIVLASRGLGASSYGRVMAIVAFFGWFGLLSGFPTTAFLPRLMANDRLSRQAKYCACSSALWISLGLTLLSVGGAIAFLPVVEGRLRLVSLHTVAVAYALIFLFTQLRTALDSASQSAGWLGRWAASNLLATALPVCFLALFPAFFKALTPGSYVALLAVAGALSIGASLALYFEAVGGWKALRPDPSILGQIASAGRGPWLALLTNTMAASGVPTLIAAFLPSKELGYFSVAVSLYLWISGAGMAVTVPAMWDWARLAAAHDLQAVKKDLRRRQRATGIVMTSAALVMFVGAGPIVRTLYGQDFAPAVPMVRLVALNVVMTGFGSWYWHMFLALGQSGRVAVPNIASNIPSLGLAYVFLRFTNWGATGAILAGVIGGAFWIGAYELELRAALRQEKRRAGVMPH